MKLIIGTNDQLRCSTIATTVVASTRMANSILLRFVISIPLPNLIFMENIGISHTSNADRITDSTGTKTGPAAHSARKQEG